MVSHPGNASQLAVLQYRCSGNITARLYRQLQGKPTAVQQHCLPLEEIVDKNARPLNPHTSPPDPWTYLGPKRKYKLTDYRNPGVNLGSLATFLLTCMGDIFDATATQGFKPDEPYPDGVYNCHLRYVFPHSKPVFFALEMKKTEAPGWSMTFSDVADDLEALWYAALWFEGRATGFPELYFGVYAKDTPLLVSRGNFKFTVLDMANVSSG